MTATLSKSQAELPRLVEIASQGEHVVITVEGKPQGAADARRNGGAPRELSREEKEQWLAELAELRARCSTGKQRLTVEQILDETRADRV